MNKIFLILIVCISFLSLRAQEDYTDNVDYAEEDPITSPIQAQLDKAIAKFQLTDEQVPQMETLLLEYAQGLQDNPPASPQAKGARRRALRASVSKILTPEQLQLMRQGNKRGGARRQAGKPNASRPQSNNSWFDRLIDDIAKPLLEQHQQSRRGGGRN